VRNNIAAFGGDPKLVTIFGQSSGGTASLMLLTAPAAKGLFHRAILEVRPLAFCLCASERVHDH
jgi:para-nitrobenzyl esterase